jgi:hypothetical protein
MTIQEIYKKYDTMSSVANHMLSVAALTKYIFELKGIEDGDDYIVASLLHDIGKIVSFKLGHIPNSLGDKPVEYWEAIQDKLRMKYGRDGTVATQKMLTENNINGKILETISKIRFSLAEEVDKEKDMYMKIVCYADQRITPFGIAPLQYRMEEGGIHYMANKNITKKEFNKTWTPLAKAMYKIEKSIFKDISNDPNEITDADLAGFKRDLLQTEI